LGHKKILIVIGSPRKKGNSAILANQVAKGAEAIGAEVESFFLQKLDIQPCMACETCREEGSKDCVIDDQMQILYPKLRAADAVVIASPIYWFTISAQTKLFMDRCGGPEARTNVIAGKNIGIVLTYGDTDPFTSGAINALRTFQDTFNYIGARIVGMIYGSALKAGDIKKNRKLIKMAYELGKQLYSAA